MEQRKNIYRTPVQWRYCMSDPKLTFFDARLTAFIFLFLFHIRLWTFLLLILAISLITIANYFQYSLSDLWRFVRSSIVGNERKATSSLRIRQMVEYASFTYTKEATSPE